MCEVVLCALYRLHVGDSETETESESESGSYEEEDDIDEPYTTASQGTQSPA